MMSSILVNMAVEIRLYPTFGYYEQTRYGYEFIECHPVEPDPDLRSLRSAQYSGWEVRADFLSRFDPGINEFVKIYGRFSPPQFDLLGPDARAHFQRCKSFLRELMTTETACWPEIRERYPKLAPLALLTVPFHVEWTMQGAEGEIVPVGRVAVRTALEAMIATVLFDKANGARFAFCQNCGRGFAKQSGHDQIYHSTKCGDNFRHRREYSRKKAVLQQGQGFGAC